MSTSQTKGTLHNSLAKFCLALTFLAACTGATIAPIGQGKFELEEEEARLWLQARELQSSFDRSGLVYEDALLTTYLSQVVLKLIPPAVSQEMSFVVKVLKHPTPNAFALPHGTFYIHTGMLAQMEDEAQLASVVGHELSHIINRHTLQTFRTTRQAAAFGTTVGVIGAPAGVYGLGVILLGSLGTLAAVSGYSQALEDEADAQGLRLMVQAGYDPRAALKVIANLKSYVEEAEIKEPFFFSTHPLLEERIASYGRLIESDYRVQHGRQGKEEYRTITEAALLENVGLEVAKGRFGLAQKSLEKSLALNANNPKGHFLLAELFRQRGSPGDKENAEKEYLKTVELKADFADAYRGLGLLALKTGSFDVVRKYFGTYLALKPEAKDRAYIEEFLKQSLTEEEKP